MSPLTKSAAINLPAVALAACLGVLAVGCGGGGDTSTSNPELKEKQAELLSKEERLKKLEKEKEDLEKSGTATKEQLAAKDTEIAKLKEQLADQPDDGDDGDDGDTPAPPTPTQTHLASIINIDQRLQVYNAIKLSVNEDIGSGAGRGAYGGYIISPQYTHTAGTSAGHVSVQGNNRSTTKPSRPWHKTIFSNIGIEKSNGNVSYKLDFYFNDDNLVSSRYGGATTTGLLHDQVSLTAKLPTHDPNFSIDWDSDTEQSRKITAPANFGFDGYKTAVLQGKTDTHNDVSGANATIYAEVYTNYEGSKDPELDYRAGGIWVIIPEDMSQSDDYHFGAFAQGSNPFEGGIDVKLTGTATYNGNALGLHTYLKGDTREVKRLTGDVTLNVNFKNATEAGTITGQISELKLNGQAATGRIDLPRVTFAADAPAFGSSGGYSKPGQHKSLGYINGVRHLGSWTGAFLGTADTTDNDIHPKAIIGTATARGVGHPTAFGLSFVAERPDD